MTPKSYKGLKAKYDELPEDVQNFFWRLEELLSDGTHYELAIAYLFMKLEMGHLRALKCGLVRIHRCKSSKVDEALDSEHITRSHFQGLFVEIFGKSAPKRALSSLGEAEKIRDRIIHGKHASDLEFRTAIFSTLVYVDMMGSFVGKKTGKNPFGNLKGLVGKSELLEAETSYLVMKGLGFSLRGVAPIDKGIV